MKILANSKKILKSTAGKILCPPPEASDDEQIIYDDCLTFIGAEKDFKVANLWVTATESSSFKICWDGKIQFSTDHTIWSDWDGSAVQQSANKRLYMRGVNNTYINIPGRNFELFSLIFTSDVYCRGNCATLFDYANPPSTLPRYAFYNTFQKASADYTEWQGDVLSIPDIYANTVGGSALGGLVSEYWLYNPQTVYLSTVPTETHKTPWRIPMEGTLTNTSALSGDGTTAGLQAPVKDADGNFVQIASGVTYYAPW